MNALPGARALERAGLGLQAVIDVAALPSALAGGTEGYRQLILFGHAGRRFWQALEAGGLCGSDPVDSASRASVFAWADAHLAGVRHRLVYPALPDSAALPLNLGALGDWLGWQRPSPLGLGIHPSWGTWFAYRAALLADSALPVTRPTPVPNPCESCLGQPCLTACPAGATALTGFRVEACVGYRLRPASPCAGDCPARRACPVGREHAYSEAQMRHAYGVSLERAKLR